VFILIAALLLVPVTPSGFKAAAAEILEIGFEDGTTMGFEGRCGDGTEILTVTDEAAHSGNYSLLTTGRALAWHGPSLNVTEYVEPGITYDISVWVLAKTPESSQFRLSTQIGEGSAASYANLQVHTISSSDGWVELTGRSVYPESGYITIYVENDTTDAEFYIDDVTFSSPLGEGMQIDTTLPSLADVYKDYFLIGSAYSRSDFAGARFELIKHHFNVMTAANDMKPDALGGSEKGEFNFARADAMIDMLEEAGILSHGHTLIWHQQSPPWLNENPDGTVLTRAEARANMEYFITTVAEHFAGRVISWDVVNEAFENSRGNAPADWRDALRRGRSGPDSSSWYRAYENGADKDAGESGADYIYDAFVFTRLADPDAVLYYNDFNETERGKREAIAMMAEELNEQWKSDPRNTEPGRLLIEGLGLQAHYWVDNLDPQDVEDTILRWIETGVELSITELDIPTGVWNNFKPMDDIEEMKQALLYAKLFRIFKQYSDHIARVTVWGLDDDTSWRSEGSPLLFDGSGNAKLAFFAVIDPEGFLSGNYFDTNGEADGTPPEAPAQPETPVPPPAQEVQTPEGDDGNENPPDTGSTFIILIIAGVSVIIVAAASVIIVKKKKAGNTR